jgi:hypothetical protein
MRDDAPPSLVDFYASHRAMARAKLAAWHVGDPQFPDPRRWVARANDDLGRADRKIRAALAGLKTARASPRRPK